VVQVFIPITGFFLPPESPHQVRTEVIVVTFFFPLSPPTKRVVRDLAPEAPEQSPLTPLS